MLGGSVWIVSQGPGDRCRGKRRSARPFGLALAAIVGASTSPSTSSPGTACAAPRAAESSLVMLAQLKARVVKLVSSLVVIVTMSVAALSSDEWWSPGPM